MPLFIAALSCNSVYIALLFIHKLFVTLLCRWQPFVDTAATQLGLEFPSAHSTATHLSFHGRRSRPQCRRTMQRNLRHIHWFCHSSISTLRCWRKFSVDTALHVRTSCHCCLQRRITVLDRHTTCSSSWSVENERMKIIASYRHITNAASCRFLHSLSLPLFFSASVVYCHYSYSVLLCLCAVSNVILLVRHQNTMLQQFLKAFLVKSLSDVDKYGK